MASIVWLAVPIGIGILLVLAVCIYCVRTSDRIAAQRRAMDELVKNHSAVPHTSSAV